MDIIIYDGSYKGLLTAVFEIYEYKFSCPCIKRSEGVSSVLFGNIHYVETNFNKGKRVMLKLQSLLRSSALLKMKYAFYSEETNIENNLFHYIRHALTTLSDIEKDYSNQYVRAIEQASRKTSREAHRMKGFIRFQLSGDGLYFASIEPDHNVLPVIMKHFRDRFSSQKWLIYDMKRKYGIYYDLENISEVNIDMKPENTQSTIGMLLHENEVEYQKLWKQYFTSTNIIARKNMKLHIQHLPKRYWKHLPEKII